MRGISAARTIYVLYVRAQSSLYYRCLRGCAAQNILEQLHKSIDAITILNARAIFCSRLACTYTFLIKKLDA